MAAATPLSPIPPHPAYNNATATANSNLKSIKEVAESPNLNSIPSNYAYFSEPAAASALDYDDSESDHNDYNSVPVIDFSLLQTDSSHGRSQVIRDLGEACRRWGFFTVVNHGVPETLVESMMDMCNHFFNLSSKEKQEFEGKHVLDPIRCGTSFNVSVEEVHFWRDYLKVMVHPKFHSPSKPYGFSDISMEYCKEVRHMALVLLRGISASLGLDELEIERTMDLNMSQQILIANCYPPCPRPDLAIGMPPHSDHGLLTFLTQNQVDGLQIQYNGKWVHVHGLPNSFLVNTGDHIEIFSNGKYKSVLHRAVVNSRATRISLAIANGPSLDAIVSPASQLIDSEEDGSGGAIYKSMAYGEYVELQQSNRLNNKSILDIIRL